jgi:CubicO group peptidase (beta-lactamase class C family)
MEGFSMSSFLSNLIRLAGSFALALAAVNTAAGQTTPLNAAESDPRVLGWMQGFPPSPVILITQPDSNYFSFPKLRWTVCHLREFLPTEPVSRGIGAPVPLAYDLDETAIDALAFKPIGSNEEMTWRESLSANYTDGMLILHKGKIVYERYFGCLDEAGKHGAMSMTKSLTGLLAEILVAEGKLDDTALVSSIVPELGEQDGYMTVDGKGTPFAGDGLSAGLRDLGRIGLLMLNEGEISGQRPTALSLAGRRQYPLGRQ